VHCPGDAGGSKRHAHLHGACQSGSPRRIHPNESAVHPDGQCPGPGSGPGNASHPVRLHHAGRRTNDDAPPGEPVSCGGESREENRLEKLEEKVAAGGKVRPDR